MHGRVRTVLHGAYADLHSLRGQCQQRRLHTAGCQSAPKALQQLIEPEEIKSFWAGTFWGGQREIRVLQQHLQKCLVHLAGGGPVSLIIVGRAALSHNPGVHQHVPWARIKSQGRAFGRKPGKIGNTSDVNDGSVFAGAMKECIVESGHQWCAVATGGHVSTPKISNSRNAGAVGNDVRIADLEAEGSLVLSRSAVPNRWPVATNGCHLPGGISGFFE